ncbi:SAM-dependent methyltransferase [Nonomuraea sp. M3C6]|uniref:S-adenosyl-L-methionine-dependent methyltransferase n=1 Tax=Nonomuraea marmarensis TaxID=3351344 RepID=A0ABW7A4C4_9ACTN
MTELTGVAKTAVGAAWVRAQESERADRLFDDPYARMFVEAAGTDHRGGARDFFGDHLVFRTRFFDDYLTAAGCAQVVLLACGLDSRAYRLDWPGGVRVFELDLPELLAFKDRVLAGAEPRCERVAVPVDLREDWPRALRAAGFEPGEPTAWLAEGLLIYLSAAESAALLTRVGELSAPGSRLAFEHDSAAAADLMERARAMPSMRRVAALWKGGLGEDAATWLGARGWRARTVERAELASRYGRPSSGRGGFLVAEREAGHKTDRK